MRVILVCVTAVGLAVATAFAQPMAPLPCPAPPPTRGVRVAAEWEPVVGVLIGWPLKLPRALVVELARDVDLHVTVRDERDQRRAARTFADWGIDPDRVRFVTTGQGTGYYLPRDWGPFAVFDAAGRYRLVDGLLRDYPLGGLGGLRRLSPTNVLRLNYRPDDQASAAFARSLGVERVEVPVSLTGGNVVFDGHGTGFASRLLLEENEAMGVSEAEFRRILCREFGVTRFHFLPNFERLGIQHVDCLFKLLDEERVLVKRPPADHPLHGHVEHVIDHLRTLTNPRGRSYQILRIDTPRYLLFKLANYTNAVIANRRIYVPLFDIPADAAALETWRQAMPGYEVLGFSYDGWSFTDALHCRVRGVWDPAMLYLSHPRPPACVPWAAAIPLAVQVRDYGGAGLLADRLTLTWRVRGDGWRVESLRPGGVDKFQATLTGVPPGATVEYYFTAASASGRHETTPRTAPLAVYALSVGR